MKAASGVSAPNTVFKSPAPTMAARMGANSAATAMPSDQKITQCSRVRASYISSPKKTAPP